MVHNFEVKEVDEIGSDHEQGMQGSKVLLPRTSDGDENRAEPSLWRTDSVDNCAPIRRDLELHGQG
jgi:hypothetical protein